MADKTSKPAAPPKSKSLVQRLRRWLFLVLLSYLMFLGLIASVQRSLIYHPHRVDRISASEVHLRCPFEDMVVTSSDGLELHGWRVRGDLLEKDQATPTTDRGPVILYFPGNAGNRRYRFPPLSLLGSLGAQVVLVDYRGYGDNAGKPTEADLAKDARTIWNHLTTTLGIDPKRIVIYGESLGGGVGSRLASELCQEGIETAGLIVQSTFNSLVAVAGFHYPYLPVSLLMTDRFASEERVKTVTCPILQIHGKLDTVVPLRYAQRLFNAMPAQSSRGIPKRQFLMEGVDHNDVYTEWTSLNQPLPIELKRFLNQVVVMGGE